MSQTKAQLVVGLNVNASAPATALQIDASGNINLDSNTLYVDATNNRVGIGTSSPVAQLETVGIVRSYRQVSGSTSLLHDWYSDNGGTKILQHEFQAGGNAYHRGNVGIGSNSPSARLNIAEGNANAVSTTSTDVNRVLLTDTSGSTSAGVGYSLDFEGTYGGLGRIAISKSNSNTTGTTRDNGAFRLFLNQNLGADSYAAFTEALTIDSGGADQGLIYRFRGTEQFRVDSSGRFLVGTSSFTGEASLAIKASSAGSGTQAMLVLQRGQTNPAPDLTLGVIKFADADSTGHIGAEIAAQSDGGFSWASGDYPTRLVFSTTLDGASSPTERMRISNTGEILFGTTASTAGVGGISIQTNLTDSGTYPRLNFNSSGTADVVNFKYNGSQVGRIQIQASAVAYVTSSDYRLKENIEPVADGITRLQQLKPSRFNFIADPDKTVDGFIAHEVQTVVPEAIVGEKDAEDDDGNPLYQGIDQSKLVPLLTAALQEAVAKIETLQGMVAVNNITIDEQQHQISALAARLTALESA